MSRRLGCSQELACALGVVATWLPLAVAAAQAVEGTHHADSEQLLVQVDDGWYDDTSIGPPADPLPAYDVPADEVSPVFPPFDELCRTDDWCWQWLPAGLIYRSYMAGVHEPRMALVAFHNGDEGTFWDATLGGRLGLLRYGSDDPAHPKGYQLDFYGAAITRLDVEEQQDLEATDYVFGLPLTWGDERWQFKFGYAHVSSHLGDEHAIRVPGSLASRVNYVRDSVVFGASCFPNAAWRMYGEAGWAFHTSGGAKPFETQIGTEFSRPGPTGRAGTPFLAVNSRLRQEHGFGGDLAAQVGWMRRGMLGQTLRFGGHYYNGKSSQFQFFAESEEQIGLGLWYDF